KISKKKVALLFGYNGKGYIGLQWQTVTNLPTIETDLFKALVAAEAVRASNAQPDKVNLSRAGRTDKGVHAARQRGPYLHALSFSYILLEPGMDMVSRLNEHLPPTIRVWDVIRTTKNFDARFSCDSRVYEYMLPTYVFTAQSTKLSSSHPLPSPAPHKNAYYNHGPTRTAPPLPTPDSTGTIGDGETPLDPLDVPEATEAESASLRAFRCTAAHMATLRAVFAAFVGTHSFHNFTIGKSPTDAKCIRYMMELTVHDPEIHHDMEWVRVTLHGQSFILHQIRKMIGLAILIVRTGTPSSIVPKTLSKVVRLNIPKAPGFGLWMEEPRFKGWN
ncbi:pseudouridine synthase, partial [Blyttiomyces helicus]